jgi:multiple antibiotic resistance protein
MDATVGQNLWNTAWAFFGTINPIAVALIFVSLTAYYGEVERTRMIRNGCAIGFFLLLAFGYGGKSILNFLGLSMASVEIASGFALVFLGLSALRSKETGDAADRSKFRPNLSVVPLAIPFLGSPAALACAMYRCAKVSGIGQNLSFIGAILFAVGICYGFLLLFSRLLQTTGKIITNLLFRLSGLLTLALAIQHILSGLGHLFPEFFSR